MARCWTRGSEATALGLAAALFFAPSRGLAAPSRADALFEQGRQMLEAGDYTHACPKLAESYSIDAATGTLLALALCDEGLGKTATALREFRGVVDAAARDGRADRVKFAGDHVAKLEALVPRLTVVVAPEAATTPGIEVAVDGAPLARTVWGAAQPVDPGAHEVSAHATGKQTWRARVPVERGSRTVTVPALADESQAPAQPQAEPETETETLPPEAPAPPPTADAAPGSARRTAGFVVGGAGVLALGVGAFFGIDALSKNSDATSQCPTSRCTSPDAVAESKDALTYANVANVVIGVGLVALAVGAYLVLTAPHATQTAVTVRATPLGLAGTF